MREILFRGKRCDNGEWVQGFYVRADHHWHNHGIHKDWIICGASANGGWFALHNKYPVIAKTIGQFTGLTDKNGKKIFEGDIMRNAGNVVEFCDDCFCINGDSPLSFWKDTEVIGNIHDVTTSRICL
jgi:uncharacterized phage protein (TIGR01671 family)